MRAVASNADLEECETNSVAAWGDPGALRRRRVSSISMRTSRWLGASSFICAISATLTHPAPPSAPEGVSSAISACSHCPAVR
eukprot:scaffold104193_cov63-Phaeocystis_antarctica.AAC.2